MPRLKSVSAEQKSECRVSGLVRERGCNGKAGDRRLVEAEQKKRPEQKGKHPCQFIRYFSQNAQFVILHKKCTPSMCSLLSKNKKKRKFVKLTL
jgi:hypothetical protein